MDQIDTKSKFFKELSIKEKVAIWKDLQKEGKLTKEDYKEVVECLREGRLHNVKVSAKAKKETQQAELEQKGKILLDDLKANLGI